MVVAKYERAASFCFSEYTVKLASLTFLTLSQQVLISKLYNICFQLGVKTIFTHGADFSVFSPTRMHVGHMIQKAFVEVNEKGTEAAAATGELWDEQYKNCFGFAF